MILAEAAYQSNSLPLLLWTAMVLGFLHTILGPDHYVPFVLMSKSENWSRSKTMWIVILSGLGHVGSSVVVGLILVGAGMAASGWPESTWEVFQEKRGNLSAWLLIGFGVALLIWGVIQAFRSQRHIHTHAHEDGSIHIHEHAHSRAHMHVHDSKIKRLTPWVLFTIFIFGPCESLVPLMLAAWATAGLTGMVLVTSTFSLVTVATILGTVVILMKPISRLQLGNLDRWSSAIAGSSLVLCGTLILGFGL